MTEGGLAGSELADAIETHSARCKINDMQASERCFEVRAQWTAMWQACAAVQELRGRRCRLQLLGGEGRRADERVGGAEAATADGCLEESRNKCEHRSMKKRM